MDDRTEPVRWDALAEILSLMPGVPEQLLAEHTDAGCGRCRSCTQPGTGVPAAAWPCPMQKLATLAVEIRGRRG